MGRKPTRKKQADPAPERDRRRAPAPSRLQPDGTGRPAGRRPVVLLSLGLVLLVALVFNSVRAFDFIELDDPGYVRDNPFVTGGLTWPAIVWAWTTGHGGNWHPLTWMSHMVDVELFGRWPGGHHLMNVGLHAANAVLLFTWLVRATGALGPSAFVATVFAVHPTHVESVAWIAERKDVLSTLFWMLTLHAYLSWTRRPQGPRYALVFGALALGLTAKPMLVTVPFVLLLVDIWPLGRWPGRGTSAVGLVVEKLPLFALVAASSAVTFLVQRASGAVADLDVLPLSLRAVNALVAYADYLRLFVWPVDLALYYPYRAAPAPETIAAAAATLLGLSAAAAWTWRRRPYGAVGWLWFLGTLVPVIGLVQVGVQARADRYTYVPYVGLTIAVAWIADSLTAARRSRRAVTGAATAAVAALAAVAYAQVQTWRDNWTVWSHALAVTRDNALAHNEVGKMLAIRGRHDEALPHFETAARIRPDFAEAHNNLGLEFSRRGRSTEALDAFRRAVALKPSLAEAQHNLGLALFNAGKFDEAIVTLREAIRQMPDAADSRTRLGFLLASRGELDEAIGHFREAIRLEPGQPAGHMYLAMALGAKGDRAEAARHLREVLRLDPANDAAREQLRRLEGR